MDEGRCGGGVSRRLFVYQSMRHRQKADDAVCQLLRRTSDWDADAALRLHIRLTLVRPVLATCRAAGCSIDAVKGRGGTDALVSMKCVTAPAYQTISRVLPVASVNIDSACLLQSARGSSPAQETPFDADFVVETPPLREPY